MIPNRQKIADNYTTVMPLWWKGLAALWLAIVLLSVGAFVGRVVGNSGKSSPPLIDTNLLAILPHYQTPTLKEALAVIDAQRNRQLLLSASFKSNHSSTQKLTVLLEQVSRKLRDSGLFILPNAEEQFQQHKALSAVLWNYRQQLLSHNDLALLQDAQHEGEKILTEKAMTQLYGFNRTDEALLRDDPLFLFQRYLQMSLPAGTKNMTLQGDWLRKNHQQRQYYLLPLKLKKSAFDSGYQQSVKQILSTIENQIFTEQGEFSAVGTVVFAEQGFSQSKNEMSTVGLGGLLGIVILLLLVFRSTLPLLWLLLALAVSLVMALHVALWCFGSLHIFALLFSAAIVGISADYGFHFFTDVYTHQNHRTTTIRRIFSGLTLGVLSSVLAYALFTSGEFAVLSQVAVLAVVGLPSMYLTVVLLFAFAPLPKRIKPLPKILQRVAKRLLSNPLIIWSAPYLSRPWGVLLLLGIVGFTVWRIPANDDVRALQSLSASALADEQHLRTLFDQPYISDYTVMVGKNLDNLLTLERQQLNHTPDAVWSAQAVSNLLPDSQHQHASYKAYQRLYSSSSVKDYAEQLGNLPNLTIPAFQSLNVEKIAKLPAVKQRFAERLVELSDGQWALFMPIRTSNKINNVRYDEANNPNIRIYHLNPTADMSAQFSNYRKQLTRWLAMITGMLLLLGIWRYGSRGIIVAALPVLTALSAVVMVFILGLDINLFSVLAVLLLLGMGLDYVIFLAENQHSEKVMISLCLSCATTILSFGLLALSQTAAVATFGLTVTVGMVLILLFSPVVVRTNNETTKK